MRITPQEAEQVDALFTTVGFRVFMRFLEERKRELLVELTQPTRELADIFVTEHNKGSLAALSSLVEDFKENLETEE